MPLRDKRVLVTRAVHQAGELADLLREYGATPLLYPCIAIQPPADTAALDQAIRQAAQGAYDYLLMTSPNAVEALQQRLSVLGLSLAGLPAAAIGPSSAETARQRLGLKVEILPEDYASESLAAALKPQPGMRIFLPQADLAAPDLCDSLCAAGADVDCLTAYHTVLGQGGVDLLRLLCQNEVDALTFTSSSTVSNCLIRLRNEGGDFDLLRQLPAACIGPKTGQTALNAGFERVLVPPIYTLAAMLALLDSAS